jgi:hypothetical protein
MPRIIDRRTGAHLGRLTESEYAQLMALFEEPTRDEEPIPIDPEVVARLAESGASERLLSVLQQMLEGREDYDLGFEPDQE